LFGRKRYRSLRLRFLTSTHNKQRSGCNDQNCSRRTKLIAHVPRSSDGLLCGNHTRWNYIERTDNSRRCRDQSSRFSNTRSTLAASSNVCLHCGSFIG
jgi:hypothetical protein